MKPRATYRLQFHRGFPFAAATQLAGYFRDLGISHVYASPILKARAESMHGYDVVDHGEINPELGGEAAFLHLAATLRAHGLGLILDIVPNHVAVGQADNDWWLDLLQNGRGSAYADYFDIDWDAPGLEGKVFAPFLDGPPDQAWEKDDLRLVRDARLSQLCFAYFEHRFPLRLEDQGLTHIEAISRRQAMDILGRQNFVLADWREADRRINWRRFFDITGLAAIQVMNPKVFEATHAKILSLYGQGAIDGFRVDHVDGIADPQVYCRTLRQRMEALRPGGYLVVEKILAATETLPSSWKTDGTTGYDFMNEVSALLHRPDGGRMEALWQGASGRHRDFETEEIEARQEMLATKFVSQCDATVRAFQPLLPGRHAIRAALIAVLAMLRCYRSYATGMPGSPGQGGFLAEAFARARQRHPALAPTLSVLEALFDRKDGDPAVVNALRRFSQLCAPLAAKAVEDTAFYRYGRLLSRNDVGFDPRRHWLSVQEFHARMRDRACATPAAMLALSTHDHKRGADARARLAALPMHAGPWEQLVRSAPRPDTIHPGDAYQLYQTVLGAWPKGGMPRDFASRIEGWCMKYLREAKLRSSWNTPDLSYEQAVCGFARDLLCDPKGADWRAELGALLQALEGQAARNQIVQTVLQLTVPGIPDIYQGCEFEDFSLVDPDNRRPVNYADRIQALASGSSRKQAIIARLLQARRAHPNLWAMGDYRPVPGFADEILAFTRGHGNARLFVICQLADFSQDGFVALERDMVDLVEARPLSAGRHALSFLLRDMPAAVLLG